MMTLVRERRQQHALRLPLPPQITAPDELRHQLSLSSPLPVPVCDGPDSPGIESLTDLEKLVVLGHGNGGTVYKVQHRWSNSIYALKVLRFSQDTVGIRQQAAREAEILKRVDSQYVVKCHGVFDNGSDVEGGNLCFVMEYMEGGSLHDVLQVHQRLPERVISDVAKRVLEGLKYLHAMKIVHRDIKPSNLLINSRGDVKIADFGVSTLDAACYSCAGTCAYMSPERFDPDRWARGENEGFAGDVWSLGVAMLECYMGHFPLIEPGQRPDWATLMCAICFSEPPEMETASPEFRSFIQCCLEKDWRRRGTVQELLSHPFVTKCSTTTDGLVDGFPG
ncbi:mitogen-activated protein kinase kinase 10-like [Telopea speciosissima]|uniref:mitogen-activated protein kinase kinase 10-like n=1 Tax=Telopea speciosissima TaxID=54955 RepID=UPI001CC6F214|nr:mitogen-activated protein kinase kinase 10-like [Telopea speciosissima]